MADTAIAFVHRVLGVIPTSIGAIGSAIGPVTSQRRSWCSAVIAYLDDQDRRTFSTLMRGLVDDGACRWVSNEAEDVLPDIRRTAPSVRQDALHFILGVDGQAVARTHQHGAAMIWLERAALT